MSYPGASPQYQYGFEGPPQQTGPLETPQTGYFSTPNMQSPGPYQQQSSANQHYGQYQPAPAKKKMTLPKESIWHYVLAGLSIIVFFGCFFVGNYPEETPDSLKAAIDLGFGFANIIPFATLVIALLALFGVWTKKIYDHLLLSFSFGIFVLEIYNVISASKHFNALAGILIFLTLAMVIVAGIMFYMHNKDALPMVSNTKSQVLSEQNYANHNPSNQGYGSDYNSPQFSGQQYSQPFAPVHNNYSQQYAPAPSVPASQPQYSGQQPGLGQYSPQTPASQPQNFSSHSVEQPGQYYQPAQQPGSYSSGYDANNSGYTSPAQPSQSNEPGAPYSSPIPTFAPPTGDSHGPVPQFQPPAASTNPPGAPNITGFETTGGEEQKNAESS